MSEERRINEIEDMLREAGAPESPPAAFHAAARRAALDDPQVVSLKARRSLRVRSSRFALAAAVLVASTAAALVIGVGGSGMQVDRSVHLDAVGAATQTSASAVMDIGTASDNVRQLVVHVDGLKPAPPGGYYELWMQNRGDEPTGIVAFDTGGDGHVDATSTLPAGLTWTKCWVTLERADGSRTVVLAA